MTIMVFRYLTFFFVFTLSIQVMAKDLVPNFFENTIATFTDATEMLYRSFNVVEMSKKHRINKKLREKSKTQNLRASPEEVRSFLRKKGITASLLSQPIVKEDFAKLLFQRFTNLPQGFLTKSLQFKRLYFNDAQNLQIFSHSESAEETLTLKDMFGSFLKASKISSY